MPNRRMISEDKYANSEEYERKLEKKAKYYSTRISKHLDEMPLTGYDIKVDDGKKSLIIRFSSKETGLTKDGIIRDFNYTLRRCEEAIGAEPFNVSWAYKSRELRIIPKGLEAKAFLKPFGKLVCSRKIKG